MEIQSADTCGKCGHIADLHRLDDATNVSPVSEDAKFRCIWPMLTYQGGVTIECDCPDFVEAQ